MSLQSLSDVKERLLQQLHHTEKLGASGVTYEQEKQLVHIVLEQCNRDLQAYGAYRFSKRGGTLSWSNVIGNEPLLHPQFLWFRTGVCTIRLQFGQHVWKVERDVQRPLALLQCLVKSWDGVSAFLDEHLPRVYQLRQELEQVAKEMERQARLTVIPTDESWVEVQTEWEWNEDCFSYKGHPMRPYPPLRIEIQPMPSQTTRQGHEIIHPLGAYTITVSFYGERVSQRVETLESSLEWREERTWPSDEAWFFTSTRCTDEHPWKTWLQQKWSEERIRIHTAIREKQKETLDRTSWKVPGLGEYRIAFRFKKQERVTSDLRLHWRMVNESPNAPLWVDMTLPAHWAFFEWRHLEESVKAALHEHQPTWGVFREYRTRYREMGRYMRAYVPYLEKEHLEEWERVAKNVTIPNHQLESVLISWIPIWKRWGYWLWYQWRKHLKKGGWWEWPEQK